jgi:hypothetical protein
VIALRQKGIPQRSFLDGKEVIISLKLDAEHFPIQPALYFSRVAPYNAGRKGIGGRGN